MATVNLASGQPSTGALQYQGFRATTMQKIFDATKYPLAQNDIARLFILPAYAQVQMVMAEVLTVEGAARNYQIYDEGATTFIAATTGNTLGCTMGTTAKFTGTTAGTFISLTAPSVGGLTACKIRVVALVFAFD